MNATRMLTTLSLCAALALTACAGGQKQPQQSPETKQSEQKGGGGGGEAKNSDKKADPVKDGAKKMRSELENNLRPAVEAGDAPTAKKSTQALDATWEKIEGEVQSSNPQAYDKIEGPLHTLIAGVGLTPVDKASMLNQIDVLDDQLAQLTKSSNKNGGTASKKVDIKTGAAAMRYHIQAVGASLEKDTAAAQKAAKAADETWEKFQSQVKKQNKGAYDKIEEGMHNLLAALQATPTDKKQAAEQVPKLDAQLGELLK